jgi:hypothetical protein
MNVWSWIKRGLPQGHGQIDVEFDLVQHENKVETTMKNHNYEIF